MNHAIEEVLVPEQTVHLLLELKRPEEDVTQTLDRLVFGAFLDRWLTPKKPIADPQAKSKPWRDILVQSLQQLGDEAHLDDICRVSERIRTELGLSIAQEFRSTVSRALQDHCSDCSGYRGPDLFYQPHGKYTGIWALRTKPRAHPTLEGY